jgi:hypothetical protein
MPQSGACRPARLPPEKPWRQDSADLTIPPPQRARNADDPAPVPPRHPRSTLYAGASTAMPISIYDASIPPMIRALRNLSAILKKGAADAKTRKYDPKVLVEGRLYPDMFHLARQVQIATDVAKGAAARLAGMQPPKYADDESTFPELVARIDRTIKYLRTFKRGQFEDAEDRTIRLPLRSGTLEFKGLPYLTGWVLPNFYFHVTTAYAILRHNGVAIGKMDFLGKV